MDAIGGPLGIFALLCGAIILVAVIVRVLGVRQRGHDAWAEEVREAIDELHRIACRRAHLHDRIAILQRRAPLPEVEATGEVLDALRSIERSLDHREAARLVDPEPVRRPLLERLGLRQSAPAPVPRVHVDACEPEPAHAARFIDGVLQ